MLRIVVARPAPKSPAVKAVKAVKDVESAGSPELGAARRPGADDRDLPGAGPRMVSDCGRPADPGVLRMSQLQSIDYAAVAPVLIVSVAALGALVADLFLPLARRSLALWIALSATVLALITIVAVGPGRRGTFCAPATTLPGGVRVGPSCSYVVDHFTVLFGVIFCLAAVIVLLLSVAPVAEDRLPAGEYAFLILCSLAGMLTIAGARRPHHDCGCPGGALPPALRPGRPAPRRSAIGRGGAEVLPDLGGVGCGELVRRQPDLWPDRLAAPGPHRRRSRPARRSARPQSDGGGGASRTRGLRLQGLGRAVPCLGAGHLPGRARADRRLPLDGLERGRPSGSAVGARRGLPPDTPMFGVRRWPCSQP